MKKILAIVLTIVLILGLGATAFAQNPGLALNLQDREVTAFPYTYTIRGTFTSPAIQDLTLYVNDVLTNYTRSAINQGTFEIDWIVPQPGTYTIKVTARHGNDNDDEEADVVISLAEQTVIVDYPAAPAVANHILKAEGKSNTIGKGKGAINLISEVAKEMGPGTTFNGVEKSDVEAYKAEVRAFLEGLGAFL